MQAPFADPLSGLTLQTKTLPLVGRETELQFIRMLLDGVAHDLPVGARTLIISGETGIGKTRLLAEVYEQAQARGFRVLEGRTYESGRMFPYLPFIEALRPVLRATSQAQLRYYMGLDGNGQSTAGDAAEVISLVGTPMVVALARLFPELPRTLHVTATRELLSPDQEKFRLLDAIATLLERVGSEQPVLLGIDNLQWADSASLELTMYLTVRLHRSRVALVGVTRPPGMPAGDDVGEQAAAMKAAMAAANLLGDLVRQGLLLPLLPGPLDTEAAGQHLHRLLPGTLSPTLAQSLLQRAGGNPFFLEELVRMLTLNRQLVLRAGTWRATQGFDTALPDSITSAVEQRLQELSSACREMLRVAALFGRTFPLDALVRVLEENDMHLTPARDVTTCIAEAVQAGVIAKSPSADSSWEETNGSETDDERLPLSSPSSLAPVTYVFSQNIVQEVLSADVPPHRARTLHGAIGVALEAGYGEAAPAHAPELARHYVQSGEKTAALHWSLLAGEDAARQQAHREAISHFRLVLKLLETGTATGTLAPAGDVTTFPSKAQLYIAIGESWFKLGELDQAQAAFQQALDAMTPLEGNVVAPLAGARHDTPLQVAQANRLLADVYRIQAKYDLALAHLQVARATLDQGIPGEAIESTWFPGRSLRESSVTLNLERASKTERILYLQAEATLNILFNRAREAEAAFWQTHQLATEIGDRGSQAFALHMVGWLRSWGEQIPEAIRLQEQAHELYIATGDPFRAVLGEQGLGIIYQALGEMERARMYTEQGFARARRYGVRRMLGWLHWNAGVWALTTGDWASSETSLQQALQEATANNDVRLKPLVLQVQAELHFRRGNWHEAEQLFQESIQAAANTEWLAGTIALYGHFLAVTGRRAAAHTQLDRAATMPEPPGFGGHFYIPFLAEGYLHLEAHEQATKYIDRIRSLHGFMYYGNAVDRILGVVAAHAGDWELAEQAFEEGLALCKRAHNQPEEAAILYEQARTALMRSRTEAGEQTSTLQQMYELCTRARTLFQQYHMQRGVVLVDTLRDGVRQLEHFHPDRLIEGRRDSGVAGQPLKERERTAARLAATTRRTAVPEQPGALEQLAHPGYQLDLTLTKRELEVLRLVAEGHTDREVADTLVLSPRTVNRHLSNIFVKLDVPGRAAAVAYAVRQGLV